MIPVVCELHIHRLKVVSLFKFWIKFKGHIFFMNLKKKQFSNFIQSFLG